MSEESPVVHVERTPLDMALTEAMDIFHLFSPTLSIAKASTMALWDAHTWCIKPPDNQLAYDQTPRLGILGETSECGKTTILKLNGLMSRNGKLFGASTATAPGLLNVIREQRATLCMDEIHKLVTRVGNSSKGIFEIMNTGYEDTGQSLNATGFQSTFAALAFSGKQAAFLGNPHLEDTRTRTIIIFMEKPPHPMDDDDCYDSTTHREWVRSTGRTLGARVQQVLEDILDAKPSMVGLKMRMRQIWKPLFQIAEVAGGAWPQMVMDACRELSLKNGSSETILSPQDQLRNYIAAIVCTTEGNLTVTDIAKQVHEAGGGAWWSSLNQGSRAVAQAIRNLGLEAHSVWVGNGPANGYKREELEETFKAELAAMGKHVEPATAPGEMEL